MSQLCVHCVLNCDIVPFVTISVFVIIVIVPFVPVCDKTSTEGPGQGHGIQWHISPYLRAK